MLLSETVTKLAFLGLCLYAILHGWRMATQPPRLYWHDQLVVTLVRLLKGTETAEDLQKRYVETSRLRTIGILNLFAGLILFISLIYWFSAYP